MSRSPRAGDDTEGGFLSRWSRRKSRADRAETVPDTGDAAPGPAAPDQAGPDSPETVRTESAEPEPVKTDEDMPDLETIDETTNMSDFFSPGVSEELRNQALRRLFHMAKFNVTDGLDDYAGDFRNFAPLGDIVTSDMRHRLERERQRQESEELAREGGPPAADPETADPDEAAGDGDDETGTTRAAEAEAESPEPAGPPDDRDAERARDDPDNVNDEPEPGSRNA